MAIVFDKQLGNNVASPAGTTLALTTANAVASGGFIVLLVGWFHATGTLTSVTGGSLTWSIDKTVKNGSVGVALVSAQAPAGLAASTVLTANYSASSTSRGISGASFTGIATSAPVDASASATANSTNWTGGGVITTNANDVVIGAAMGDSGADTTSTPTATWTEVPATAGDFNTAGNGDTFTMVYRIVSSTATYTPGGTWGVTDLTAGVGVAYMAAAGGGGGVTVKQLSALGVG